MGAKHTYLPGSTIPGIQNRLTSSDAVMLRNTDWSCVSASAWVLPARTRNAYCERGVCRPTHDTQLWVCCPQLTEFFFLPSAEVHCMDKKLSLPGSAAPGFSRHAASAASATSAAALRRAAGASWSAAGSSSRASRYMSGGPGDTWVVMYSEGSQASN